LGRRGRRSWLLTTSTGIAMPIKWFVLIEPYKMTVCGT
jgi:hypothetical protein